MEGYDIKIDDYTITKTVSGKNILRQVIYVYLLYDHVELTAIPQQRRDNIETVLHEL